MPAFSLIGRGYRIRSPGHDLCNSFLSLACETAFLKFNATGT
jgi:hypothetical protein